MDRIKNDSASSASAAGTKPDLQDLVSVVTVMAEALQDKVTKSDQALKKLLDQTDAINQVLYLASEKAESARAAERMCSEQKSKAVDQARSAQVEQEPAPKKKPTPPMLPLTPKAAASPPPAWFSSASAGGGRASKGVERKRLMSDIAQPATQEYLLARDAETLPPGVVWLKYQNHLVKSNDDPALVEKVMHEATPGLLNREEKISRYSPQRHGAREH